MSRRHVVRAYLAQMLRNRMLNAIPVFSRNDIPKDHFILLTANVC